MQTGIYLLHWEEPDLYYVGQSTNISRRFSAHKTTAKHNAHRNYKVQEAFNKYGIPILTILDICEIELLEAKEQYWVTEFKSPSLLNLSEVGPSNSGTTSSGSKYSKFTILKVFSLLYNSTLTYKDIALKCDTNIAIPGNICRGDTHIWLKEEYPEQYALMISNRENAAKVRIMHNNSLVPIVYKTGEVFTITNISEFARQQSKLLGTTIDSASLSKLLRGKIKSHKGFQLASSNSPLKDMAGSAYTNYKFNNLRYKDGTEYLNVTNSAEFCRNNSVLRDIPFSSVAICKLLKGTATTRYGFTSF